MSDGIRILIVEDLPTDAELCEREIEKVLPESRFMRVETQEDFLAALERFQPGLIISDYKLPRFDGMTALKLALTHAPETPFIILTGSMNEETAVACMKAGAWDYVIKEHIRRLGSAVISALGQKKVRQDRRAVTESLRRNEELFRKLFEDHTAVKLLIDPDTGNIVNANEAAATFYGWSRERLKEMKMQEINTLPPEDIKQAMEEVRAQQRTHFEFRHRRADGSIRDVEVFNSKIDFDNKDLLHAIVHDITDRKLAEEKLGETLESLRKAVAATIRTITAAIETRDPYTAGHQKRVTDLARTIADEMGLPKERVEGIRMAGSIHDIGKILVPAEILSKPTKLGEIEFKLIKTHAQHGYEILKEVESPWPLADMVRQHHERLDGSGYPQGLKGGEILLEARIIAVADVVEAMSSHRPYRPAIGMDAALEEIEKNKGILYDPDAVETCLRLIRDKGFKFE